MNGRHSELAKKGQGPSAASAVTDTSQMGQAFARSRNDMATSRRATDDILV